MRIVFVGAGSMAVMTARSLVGQDHEVILIEKNKERIDALYEDMDCGFLHGDAADPEVLKEADPEACDFLFCVADDDQVNIIASLLGRSLGFKRVITSIEDTQLVKLCRELGLKDVIVPVRSMSQRLENMVRGLDTVELSTLMKSDARFFSFVIDDAELTTVESLELPEGARAIYFYRDNAFDFVEDDTAFQEEDEVVILTHARHLAELRDRWQPTLNGDEDG